MLFLFFDLRPDKREVCMGNGHDSDTKERALCVCVGLVTILGEWLSLSPHPEDFLSACNSCLLIATGASARDSRCRKRLSLSFTGLVQYVRYTAHKHTHTLVRAFVVREWATLEYGLGLGFFGIKVRKNLLLFISSFAEQTSTHFFYSTWTRYLAIKSSSNFTNGLKLHSPTDYSIFSALTCDNRWIVFNENYLLFFVVRCFGYVVRRGYRCRAAALR